MYIIPIIFMKTIVSVYVWMCRHHSQFLRMSVDFACRLFKGPFRRPLLYNVVHVEASWLSSYWPGTRHSNFESTILHTHRLNLQEFDQIYKCFFMFTSSVVFPAARRRHYHVLSRNVYNTDNIWPRLPPAAVSRGVVFCCVPDCACRPFEKALD